MVRDPVLRVSYDETFDLLEVFFQEPVPTLTVQLEEDIYAHIVPDEQRLVGMTIHRFREKHADYRLPVHGRLDITVPQVEERVRFAFQPSRTGVVQAYAYLFEFPESPLIVKHSSSPGGVQALPDRTQFFWPVSSLDRPRVTHQTAQ
jgi:hypothetical protein